MGVSRRKPPTLEWTSTYTRTRVSKHAIEGAPSKLKQTHIHACTRRTGQVHAPGAPVQQRRTATVQDNGFNPTFIDPPAVPFHFEAADGDTAFLRVAVMDDDLGSDRLAAVACLPLAAVRPGVRHVPLLDTTGTELPLAGVLCRFEVHRDAASAPTPAGPSPAGPAPAPAPLGVAAAHTGSPGLAPPSSTASTVLLSAVPADAAAPTLSAPIPALAVAATEARSPVLASPPPVTPASTASVHAESAAPAASAAPTLAAPALTHAALAPAKSPASPLIGGGAAARTRGSPPAYADLGRAVD
jgi:hypothetical protein